jgi:hypothetical protein
METENTDLLRDIKKLLVINCLFNIRALRKELLVNDVDQRVYDLCERATANDIADALPDVGYDAVYNRVYEWEKQGLIISEQISEGKGRPKKYYIKLGEWVR